MALADQPADIAYEEHVEWCNATVEVSQADASHNSIPHSRLFRERSFAVEWPRWKRYVPAIRLCYVREFIRDMKDFDSRAALVKELVEGTADCSPLYQYSYEVDCDEHLSLCVHDWHIYHTQKYVNPYDAQFEGYAAIHRMGAAMRDRRRN